MKLIMASILACGVSFNAMATRTGYEDPKTPVSLSRVDEDKIQLIYNSIPDGTVLVKIFDSKNILIQNDRIDVKKAFTKKYDFSKIEDGKYLIEVYDKNGKVEQLAVDFTEVKSESTTVSKLVKIEKDKYKLLVNSLFPTKISVEIYANDRLVHEELHTDVNGLQKIYTFSEMYSNPRLDFYIKTDDGFTELVAVR